MKDVRWNGTRRGWLLAIALLITVTMSGSIQTITRAAGPAPATPALFSPRRLGEARPFVAGVPVRLRVPRLSVDAAVEMVGTAADGAMDVPKRFEDTAWYQFGPRPGELGNAVIAGHVDSVSGAAVFGDLGTLGTGDRIIVVGDDGVERAFIVTEVKTYARSDAPLNRIFGPANTAHLNLITCDRNRPFDPGIQSYEGNLIVYADAAS